MNDAVTHNSVPIIWIVSIYLSDFGFYLHLRAQNPWDNARKTPLFQILKLQLYKEFRLILIWIFGFRECRTFCALLHLFIFGIPIPYCLLGKNTNSLMNKA